MCILRLYAMLRHAWVFDRVHGYSGMPCEVVVFGARLSKHAYWVGVMSLWMHIHIHIQGQDPCNGGSLVYIVTRLIHTIHEEILKSIYWVKHTQCIVHRTTINRFTTWYTEICSSAATASCLVGGKQYQQSQSQGFSKINLQNNKFIQETANSPHTCKHTEANCMGHISQDSVPKPPYEYYQACVNNLLNHMRLWNIEGKSSTGFECRLLQADTPPAHGPSKSQVSTVW